MLSPASLCRARRSNPPPRQRSEPLDLNLLGGTTYMLIVQKFGGSSVADADKVRNVARIVTETYRKGQIGRASCRERV